MSLFSLLLCSVFLGTPYILYIREKWLFSPCGRIFLFFCLDTKEKETKRKNQGYVSGPTPERPFWRWKMNSLRCTTLRQHFSTPPVHSYAHAPTTRPVFLFHAKALRCWLLAFWFYNATVLRPHLFTSLLDLMAPSFLCSFLEFIALETLSSRTEFSILRLSIYILNISLYILKLSFYILSLSIELLWWRK